MKKRICAICVSLIMVFIVILTACGKSDSITSDGENSDITAEDTANVDLEREKKAMYEQEDQKYSQYSTFEHAYYPYNNGLAWIQFSNEETGDVAGVLDKKGNVLYYSSDISANADAPISPFNDKKISFACGKTDSSSRYYKIDKKKLIPLDWSGDVPSIYDHRAYFSDDDFLCLSTVDEGIDHDNMVYQFYNMNGEATGTVTIDIARMAYGVEVRYFGHGRYAFYEKPYESHNEKSELFIGVYFAKADKWMNCSKESLYNHEIDEARELLAYSDKYLLFIEQKDVYPTESYSVTLFDDCGNITPVKLPIEEEYNSLISTMANSNSLKYACMTDTKIFMGYDIFPIIGYLDSGDDYHPYCYIYDINTESIKKFEGKYYEKMRLEGYLEGNTHNLSMTDTLLAITEIGRDKYFYSALYNVETGELIGEPRRIEQENSILFGAKFFVVNGTLFEYDDNCLVYDKDGEIIATLPGNPEVHYGDGIYVCDYGNRYAEFYDEKWNLLFTSDEINFDNAKKLVTK